MCSSPFASDEGRVRLTAKLAANLGIYAQNDYRRFLPAHLQFLQGLCKLSREAVDIAIQQLLTSSFVTTELLSKEDFNERVNATIEQSRNNAHRIFVRLLTLVRKVNHGNAVVSTYGTNYEYFLPRNMIEPIYAHTRPLFYGDGCSCETNGNCTVGATFNGRNITDRISIEGLKMGCTPSESFLVSTLVCFYNQSCIDLIQQYSNVNAKPLKPLSLLEASRFSLNTTVEELVNYLFVERWATMTTYSHYFDRCLPSTCTFSYTPKYNFPSLITTLLALQGGLSIVLEWICPRIIRIINRIYSNRKKRLNRVQPAHFIATVAGKDNTTNGISVVENTPALLTRETNRYAYWIGSTPLALFSFNSLERLSRSSRHVFWKSVW